MGKLIDFETKKTTQTKPELSSTDLIKLMPRLRVLKNEVIVVNIDEKILSHEMLLINLLREIVILKYSGAIVVLIADSDLEIEKYYCQMYGENNVFDTNNFIEITEQADVFETTAKGNYTEHIATIIKSFGAMPLVVSGCDLDIVFPNNLVNTNISIFDVSLKSICFNANKHEPKKYSIDTLNEILKTNIIPIVTQSFKSQYGNKYMFSSKLFGGYIAKYLSALKYVMVYTTEPDIPTNCIYGIEQFIKIIKTSNFKQKSLRILNAGIEAIKNDVQNIHIIDTENVSLLEEFCSNTFAGLFLYDDTLNHI